MIDRVYVNVSGMTAISSIRMRNGFSETRGGLHLTRLYLGKISEIINIEGRHTEALVMQ